ncbi:MAG TPA: holo-ACP synthase [Blastocatellia bacterium]|nr:holo-ACP synthase [Blastocatellia bacterium]
MIIGIGIDIIEIRRIERALSPRFIERVFTPREMAYCEPARRVEKYAARFAAKEAARKAIGAATPVTALSWHDVEVVSSPEGAPQLVFHGRAAELVQNLKVTRSHVSMSHSIENAIAQVILETD